MWQVDVRVVVVVLLLSVSAEQNSKMTAVLTQFRESAHTGSNSIAISHSGGFLDQRGGLRTL